MIWALAAIAERLGFVAMERTVRAFAVGLALLLAGCASAGSLVTGDAQYQLGPDSLIREGVPQGRVTRHALEDSRIYPGFQHRWYLYVPHQHDGHAPLCLMVFLDGTNYVAGDGPWRATAVLDNLIAAAAIPAMAAVFIDPGQKLELPGYPLAPNGSPLVMRSPGVPAYADTNNRGVEYETAPDVSRFADFLASEMLPEVRRHVNITNNPDGHAIAGASSGAIGAFTAAWNRPDQFRKVYASLGSFMSDPASGRGFPELVLSEPVRPIRAAFQDGANDINIFGAGEERHRELVSALGARGYDYRYDYGAGGHNPAHGASIFPEVMRWLWRDHAAQQPCRSTT